MSRLRDGKGQAGLDQDALAKAAAVLLLASRGTPFLYYGEEIGLGDSVDPRRDIVDPPARQSLVQRLWAPWWNRDQCRGPMPGPGAPDEASRPGIPGCPFAPDSGTRNVAAQDGDPHSVLATYRALLALRRASPALQVGASSQVAGGPDVYAWRRAHGDQVFVCAVNFADRDASFALPAAGGGRTWAIRYGSVEPPLGSPDQGGRCWRCARSRRSSSSPRLPSVDGTHGRLAPFPGHDQPSEHAPRPRPDARRDRDHRGAAGRAPRTCGHRAGSPDAWSRPPRPAPARGSREAHRAAKYTDDLVVPGAWYGATIRSTEPQRALLGFDLRAGLRLVDVVVLTAADIPGDNIVSALHDDQPVLVDRRDPPPRRAARALAAPDRATLRAAKRRVQPRARSRCRRCFDPLESTHEFAPYEVGNGRRGGGPGRGRHRHRGDVPRRPPGAALHREPGDDRGASRGRRRHRARLAAVPLLRPHGAQAGARLTDSQAVVVQAETGGGFGGKEEYPSMIAVHAALLARSAGKPVRMIYDRHEDIAATTKRHPAIVRYRTGVTRDGTLVAQDIDVVMDGGAYCTLTPVVLSRGVLHAGGPYRCADVRIAGRAIATNTPPNGAFRGFGAPQTEFAAEMQVNRVAEALGMSPLELRRRWVYDEGDITPTGQVLRESVAGAGGARAGRGGGRVRAHPAADARAARAAASGRRGRPRPHGIGLALAWHGAGFTGSGEVKLASVGRTWSWARTGRSGVLIASTEMGQGTKTIFPQLVAAELGIAEDDVEMAPVDTSHGARTADPRWRRGPRWSSAGSSSRRRDDCASRSRRHRAAVRCVGRRVRARPRPAAHRPAVRAVPGRPVRRRDLHRRRLPVLRLGGRGRRRSTWTSTPAR